MHQDQSSIIVLMIQSQSSRCRRANNGKQIPTKDQSLAFLQVPSPKGLFSFNKCGSVVFDHAEYGLFWV